jgi:hypothetical protein
MTFAHDEDYELLLPRSRHLPGVQGQAPETLPSRWLDGKRRPGSARSRWWYAVAAVILWVGSAALFGYVETRLERSRSPVPAMPTNQWWTGTAIDRRLERTFNGSALSDLCNETVFIAGRYFECTDIQGGVTNVMNAVMHCLRFSIASGSGMVLPVLGVRGALDPNEDNLHMGGTTSLHFIVDVDHLKQAIAEFCPQMVILDTVEMVPGYETAFSPPPFNPKDIYTQATGLSNNQGLINDHVDTFRADFDKVMGSQLPAIYRTTWPLYFQWPVASETETFRESFGGLLVFRQDAKQLASQIISSLAMLAPAYFGAHLRAEGDVTGIGGWTPADVQMDHYIAQAVAADLRVLYVGGGDPLSIQQIALKAAEHNIVVVSKLTLLPWTSLQYLNSLHFDQQAPVDYLVLLAAEKFAGVGVSSFSVRLAVERHLAYGDQSMFPSDGDRFSTVLDPWMATKFVDTMWT